MTTTARELLPELPQLSAARRRLFEAALRLFGERGYYGVSVRDVAEVLGQQPGAIYTHVASKQQLLFELVRLGSEQHFFRLRTALLDAGREPADQLRALVRAHVLSHLEYVSLSRVATRETGSLTEEQLAEVMRIRTQSEQLAVDVVTRGVALGAFRGGDLRLQLLAVSAMGVRAVEWWDPAVGPDPEHVADEFADYALRILRA